LGSRCRRGWTLRWGLVCSGIRRWREGGLMGANRVGSGGLDRREEGIDTMDRWMLGEGYGRKWRLLFTLTTYPRTEHAKLQFKLLVQVLESNGSSNSRNFTSNESAGVDRSLAHLRMASKSRHVWGTFKRGRCSLSTGSHCQTMGVMSEWHITDCRRPSMQWAR
jgi:hypothetical protein